MVNQQELIRKQQELAARQQKEIQSRMLKQKAIQVHPHHSKAGMFIFILILLAVAGVLLFIYQPWKYFFK